ncbi:MAG TPA: thioredoxin family protein [Candidatus Acidoferrales bacterium]|nr:thioredoxin family protein [Candidatus Acidoferrales bacterium]
MTRVNCVRWALIIVTLWPAALCAQGHSSEPNVMKVTGSQDLPVFAFLNHWKAAILRSDRETLATLYTTVPLAQARAPQGNSQNPSEEPAFWSALAAKGLASRDPKVLEVQQPQPGIAILILRVEPTLRTGTIARPFVVSVAQDWIRQGSDWRIYLTHRSDLSPNPPRRLPLPAKPNVDLYPPPEEAPAEIAAALSSAAKDHKHVILVYGGNRGYDCHVLDATFHSKQIAPLVNANYHVVHVNVGEEDKNLNLAKKYEVPLDKDVPSLAVLDSSGTLLYSQKNGEFESTVRIGPEDVVQFLNRWKPIHN